MLQHKFDSLPEEQQYAFKLLAQSNLERSRTLWDEVKEALLKTKGKICYNHLASHLGGIVCTNTICEFLLQQDGFYLRKDRILPHLDEGAKNMRAKWAKSFWIFCHSTKAVNPSEKLFVLVHMDKKWFYCVCIISNNKVLELIGLMPKDYYSQHKNHIGKLMYVCVTAYVLAEGNDITKGGKAIPIACERVGKFVPAKKDSFKCVYFDDRSGKYHYPKIASNWLRIQGREYFELFELTGSNEGMEERPKISLLKIWEDKIIPPLEEKIVARFNNGGLRDVVIVMQEDGAGLHCDRKYMSELKKEFEERNWFIIRQPAQLPIINIHDVCIFPMLSKAVSREQSLTFGSVLMDTEELHKFVIKVWNDKTNLVAMLRAFAGHHQVVCAILDHECDNKYLLERSGMSFGVRKNT